MAPTIQIPLFPTPDYPLIDTATAIPQLCKDSILDYMPPFILNNVDAIFILLIAIANMFLILSYALENSTLRQENAALAQALMDEEMAAMGMASRYSPEDELSDWQTSADEMSGIEAEFHRGKSASTANEGSMGTRKDRVREQECFQCLVGRGSIVAA